MPAAAGVWGAAKAAKPDWLREKKIYIAVQFATAKHPELADVPLVTELAGNEQARAALDLILTQQAKGRPFAAPPNVPAARLAALRGAFARTLNDPEFRQARARNQPRRRRNAAERMFQAPHDVVEAARRAIGQK